MTRHCDTKCFDLARDFIDDHPHLRPKVRDLAIEIQGAVEDWLLAEEQLRRIDDDVKAIADLVR